jgi:hypothetical protein
MQRAHTKPSSLMTTQTGRGGESKVDTFCACMFSFSSNLLQSRHHGCSSITRTGAPQRVQRMKQHLPSFGHSRALAHGTVSWPVSVRAACVRHTAMTVVGHILRDAQHHALSTAALSSSSRFCGLLGHSTNGLSPPLVHVIHITSCHAHASASRNSFRLVAVPSASQLDHRACSALMHVPLVPRMHTHTRHPLAHTHFTLHVNPTHI